GKAGLRGVELGACPYRDLGRSSPLNHASAANGGLTSALVADPRNDVHAAIAQLTTLFQCAHNKIAEAVDRASIAGAGVAADVAAYRSYFVSRAIVERIYRNIVRSDLLPRLLHPAVRRAYDRPDIEFVDSQPLDALPVEFGHVLRFGHAMVRQNYVFNELNTYGEDLVDMMLATSAARPWRMPLDDTWVAQWSCFFDIDARR